MDASGADAVDRGIAQAWLCRSSEHILKLRALSHPKPAMLYAPGPGPSSSGPCLPRRTEDFSRLVLRSCQFWPEGLGFRVQGFRAV